MSYPLERALEMILGIHVQGCGSAERAIELAKQYAQRGLTKHKEMQNANIQSDS